MPAPNSPPPASRGWSRAPSSRVVRLRSQASCSIAVTVSSACAPAPERAYADYLAGQITPAEVPLLPEQHRAVAGGREDPAAVQAIADPLSRLVAAGVLFRMGRAAPEIVAVAADTASQQGWRRPLLAWLGVQAQRAEGAGRREDAERIRRRMDLVSGQH